MSSKLELLIPLLSALAIIYIIHKLCSSRADTASRLGSGGVYGQTSQIVPEHTRYRKGRKIKRKGKGLMTQTAPYGTRT
jgi:hypothetical protein